MADDNKVIRVDFGARKVVGKEPEIEPKLDLPEDPEDAKKATTMDAMLLKGAVMVTLDARAAGVVVPRAHAESIGLNLNFDYDYGIPDFEVDARGVRASLSFGGRDQRCDIPWSAIYGMRSHEDDELMIFPKSFPEELRKMHPELDMLEEED
jgi:hypothetical protein